MLKRIILMLLLFPLLAAPLRAQTEEEKQVKTAVWQNAPAEFKETQVPDQWKDESAVIIASNMEYEAGFSSHLQGVSTTKFYVEKITYHYRIKLLDKAAVKDYSEITFNKNYVNTTLFGKTNSYFFIAAKIVKANGSEKEIDLNKAVKTDSQSKKGLKIAVADLEPGDILDYFSSTREEYPVGSEGMVSDNILFEEEYPVMKRIIRFKLPQEYELISKVYNGAPDFEKKMEDDGIVYELRDKMRNKSEDLLWTYEHRSSPELRYIKRTKNMNHNPMLQRAQNYANSYTTANKSNTDLIDNYMKETLKKEKDPAKVVYELYYLLRNPIYLQVLFNVEHGHPLQELDVDDAYFLMMSKYLAENKIGHNMMVVPSAKYGRLQDQINLKNAGMVMRVNTPAPIYLPGMQPFAIPNELMPELEGMESAVSFPIPKGGTNSEGTMTPVSKPEDNMTTTVFNVSLNADDNSNVDVKRSVIAKGHNKEDHQPLVVTDYDYLKEYDQPKYQLAGSKMMESILKDYNKEKEKVEQRMTQDYNERDKRMKEDIESSMEVKVTDYKNCKLQSIGMWDDAPNTIYSDEFTIENMTKKAGPNYILEISRLLEKQTEVKDKQRIRTRDIYMANTRKFVNEINFTIPEGYTVEGLENLNKEVKNSTGGFISTAKVEGNILKITSEKYYSNNYYAATDWPKMLEFLDAAVAFTNAKILLKKK